MDEFEVDQQPYADIPVYGSNTPYIDWSNVKLPSDTSYGSPLDMIYAATNQGGDVTGPGVMSTLSNLLSKAPGVVGTGIQQLLGQGSSNLPSYLKTNAGNLTALMGLYALMGGNKAKPAGYAGSIPKLTATRQAIQQPEGRRPGGPAGRYLSDVEYRAGGGYLRGATGGMAEN